tara:strand:+ start:6119 stop:6832 length:714 start_codon:yes stop_codon:yes gene_type:complete
MSIEEICNKYNIKDYIINDDGSIDVNGSVEISDFGLTEFPLIFNKVSGNFFCHKNKLTDLKGSPISVGGLFDCNTNRLTSLSGSPEHIGDGFDCSYNNLTNLKGGPKWVGGKFYCQNNKLTSLEHSPESVGESFICNGNKLTDLKGCPKSIGKDFWCVSNNIKSLEGCCDDLKSGLHLNNNPIGSMFNVIYIDVIKAFNTFKVLKEGVINLKRLRYFTEMFDINVDIEEIKKYYTIK